MWSPHHAKLIENLRDMMGLENYKIVLYRQEDSSWVAEVPAISGCYALMPTREQALEELDDVFQMISDEYREKGLSLPADTTEIVHA
jgi:predicted RNase H-like HicB family nuclease